MLLYTLYVLYTIINICIVFTVSVFRCLGKSLETVEDFITSFPDIVSRLSSRQRAAIRHHHDHHQVSVCVCVMCVNYVCMCVFISGEHYTIILNTY